MRSKREQNLGGHKQINAQRGQILVEYILLLIVAVGVAALMISSLVSRNPDDPGFLISKWDKILRFIGADPADDVKREDQKP